MNPVPVGGSVAFVFERGFIYGYANYEPSRIHEPSRILVGTDGVITIRNDPAPTAYAFPKGTPDNA
jgi:hypothetical protein